MGGRALYIVGAGGHAREVLDVVQALNAAGAGWDVLGFVADDWREGPVLSRRRIAVTPLDEVAIEHGTWITIAIGDPQSRARLAARVGADVSAATLVHPAARVASDARLEPGTMAPAGATIGSGVVIGRHTHLNVNATVEPAATIGEFVTVSPGVTVRRSAIVGDTVFVGIGAVIREGVRIGEGARIGAGAHVCEDVPAGATVVGVPARPMSAR